MGQSKQLLKINGERLLIHAVNTAISVKDAKVAVVLGSNETEHRRAIESLPVDVIVNDDWQKGIGSSIKTGLRSITTSYSPERVILMVCDQPLLTVNHLHRMLAVHRETG